MVGRLGLAYAHLAEAAFNDLHNLHHNVSNGFTSAHFAGISIAGVVGFDGMRYHGDELTFVPRLQSS